MDANATANRSRGARAAAAAAAAVLLALLCAAQPAAAGDRKVVHVFVALCDNEHQGIAPVPAKLGDGQDPDNNLYWGAMYGVKTFFRRSPDWKALAVVERSKPAGGAVLERCVFRSVAGSGQPVYVVADAYDGKEMRRALIDFFDAAAGWEAVRVACEDGGGDADAKGKPALVEVDAGGRADLVCFVGHNGLMDLELERTPEGRGDDERAAVVLACKSHEYFAGPLERAKCKPLLTTTGLMAPEAYTLDAAVRAWAAGGGAQAVRRKAAKAYADYQKCSQKAAERLFRAGS